jgi:hypothetical protein
MKLMRRANVDGEQDYATLGAPNEPESAVITKRRKFGDFQAQRYR